MKKEAIDADNCVSLQSISFGYPPAMCGSKGTTDFTMNDKESVYSGSIDDIDSVEIEKPLEGLGTRECFHFHNVYREAATIAEQAGKKSEAAVYRFLSILTSCMLVFGDKADPYKPISSNGSRRSFVPNDLANGDLVALRKLAEKAEDSSLRARLFDLLWLSEKNHSDCQVAVTAYLQAAANLDDPENWTYATKSYRRAAELARILGKKGEYIKHVSAELLKAVKRNKDTETGFRTCTLLEIAGDFQFGDLKELAAIARELGEKFFSQNEFTEARHYWRVAVKFLSSSKGEKEEDAKSINLKIGQTYIRQAEDAASFGGTQYIAAVEFLLKGIEVFQRNQADPKLITNLKAQLKGYQEKILDSMQHHELKLDVSEEAEKSRKLVEKKDLFDAIKQFVFSRPLVNVEQFRENLIQQVKKHPLQHFFKHIIFDEAGRTVEVRRNIFSSDGNIDEEGLKAHIFSEYRNHYTLVRKTVHIEPARIQIRNDHHPSIQDLSFLVSDNPFVPPGHEYIFLRGIHAGFHNDFVTASHLLVPQIENSIRYVLERNGVDVSNLFSDRTQNLKVLGALLAIEETKKIFGESLHFELRGLLVEKSGHAFRHRIAHGFVSDAECFGDAAINLWWLVIHMCMYPILRILKAQEEEDTEN